MVVPFPQTDKFTIRRVILQVIYAILENDWIETKPVLPTVQ